VPSSDPVQRFSDIIENIDRIERFTMGMDFQSFAANEQTVLAVKYSLVVISEAATKLGDSAAELCPDNPGEKFEVSETGCGTTMTVLISCVSGFCSNAICRH
jgi:uncharacterized protein with HEPN domain